MKKYTKYLSLLFVLLFYYSCTYTNKNEKSIYIETKNTTNEVKSFFEKYHYIALETNQNNLYSKVIELQKRDKHYIFAP